MRAMNTHLVAHWLLSIKCVGVVTAGWTWYASEGSPVDEDGYYDTDKEKVDFLFFGLVAGLEVEPGYFALSQLEDVRGSLGLLIERDLYFEPKTLRELKEWHDQQRRISP